MRVMPVNMLTFKGTGVNILTLDCKYIYMRSALQWCRLSRPTGEGLMVSATTDRTNYLALALDARKTINALLKASETGEQPTELTGAIDDTIESLNALRTGDLLFSNLNPHFPYQYYEQVKTLEEVDDAMKEQHVADRLSELRKPVAPDEREKILQLAIAFFSALENRALQKYTNSARSAVGG
jgi:hypothetical protein